MKYTTVSIPKPLDDKIKKIIKNTGFNSTSSFVIFVLRELIIEQKEKSDILNQEEIKERLRKLGYF